MNALRMLLMSMSCSTFIKIKPVVAEAVPLLLHHVTFPCHPHQLARGKGSKGQREGGVIGVPLLPVPVAPTSCRWQPRVLVVVHAIIFSSQGLTNPPLVTPDLSMIKKMYIAKRISLFVIRPALMHSCFHVFSKPVSHILSRRGGRTQHNGGFNRTRLPSV